MSGQTVLCGTPKSHVEPNVEKWSGDHIVDPTLVSDIFFSNQKNNDLTPKSLNLALHGSKSNGNQPASEIKGKS
jgi:hypothetical protein